MSTILPKVAKGDRVKITPPVEPFFATVGYVNKYGEFDFTVEGSSKAGTILTSTTHTVELVEPLRKVGDTLKGNVVEYWDAPVGTLVQFTPSKSYCVRLKNGWFNLNSGGAAVGLNRSANWVVRFIPEAN